MAAVGLLAKQLEVAIGVFTGVVVPQVVTVSGSAVPGQATPCVCVTIVAGQVMPVHEFEDLAVCATQVLAIAVATVLGVEQVVVVHPLVEVAVMEVQAEANPVTTGTTAGQVVLV